MMLDRDATAASLLVDALCAGTASGDRWVVVADDCADLVTTLHNLGQSAAVWRRSAGAGPAAPEPPEGPFDAAALRLPRGREALAFAIELAAARMPAGARLWAFGANDEGARSAGQRLEPFFADIESVDARRHCRLWAAVRTDAPARSRFSDFAASHDLVLPSGARAFVGFPGVFAGGDLDDGTALLLDNLPDGSPASVLDFACGIGVVSAEARARWPEATVHGFDADALAVEAARLSVPRACFACGSGWAALVDLPRPPGGYDLALSNPPLHRGRDLDLAVLESLVSQAPRFLARSGHLVFVTQRQRPIAPALEAAFGHARLVAEDSRFRVWSARNGARGHR